MSRLFLASRSPNNNIYWSVIYVLISIPHLKRTSTLAKGTWRFREPEAQSEYKRAFITGTTSIHASGSRKEVIWGTLKYILLKAAENQQRKTSGEMHSQKCSYAKAEMLEILEEWRQQGEISEGQVACKVACQSTPGRTRRPQGPFTQLLWPIPPRQQMRHGN